MIALKFAYLGQNYNGLEYHANNYTFLPAIEEELWKALDKAKLIFHGPNEKVAEEQVNWEGCEYSKCGRTDRGVSAFGQVIGIRVRSNRPLARSRTYLKVEECGMSGNREDLVNVKPILKSSNNLDAPDKDGQHGNLRLETEEAYASSFDDIHDELPYAQTLNRLLPSDIRVLAWCPDPPKDFSARFSCKERRYKYFFTNPAFTPTPNTVSSNSPISLSRNLIRGPQKKEGWLDIPTMRSAAAKFIGLHDFRNFCKVDPSKQLTNFERRIFHADISEVLAHEQSGGYMHLPAFYQQQQEDASISQSCPSNLNSTQALNNPSPRLYTFTVNGSAFLWHQVRHMVSILFLIGQGLEPPSLIDELLDVQKNPCKPHYEMADDAPLVLWDCIFPSSSTDRPTEGQPDSLNWIYVGDEASYQQGEGRHLTGKAVKDTKYGVGGVVPELWKLWRKRKMEEVLAGSLLSMVVGQGSRGQDGMAESDCKESRVGEASAGDGTENDIRENESSTEGRRKVKESQKLFLGGDECKLVGRYVPLMQRKKMESVEVINARYAKKEGLESR